MTRAHPADRNRVDARHSALETLSSDLSLQPTLPVPMPLPMPVRTGTGVWHVASATGV
jgi:hypothetical protein